MDKNTAADFFKEGAKSWAGQKGFDSIRPMVKAFIKMFPAMKPDTPIEKFALEISGMLPGFVKAAFPKNERVSDIVGEVIREVNNELRATAEDGASDKPAPSGGGKTMTPIVRKLLLCGAYPKVVYFAGCPTDHGNVKTIEEVDAGHGKKRKEARTTPRSDCRNIPVHVAAAIMDAGGHTPSSTEEGLDAACICESEVGAEVARYREELAAKAKAEAPKPKPEPIVTRDEIRAGAKWLAGQIGSAASGLRGVVTGTASTIRSVVEQAPDRIGQYYKDQRAADQSRAVDLRRQLKEKKAARAAAKAEKGTT